MSRHDPEKLYPGFPGTEPSEHIRTIPACAALGMSQRATIGAPVATSLDAALPAVCDTDGRVARGAALVLADQATAGGVFTTLPHPTPMMTLDLRVDWFGPLPAAPISCTIDEVTREGDLALSRGHLTSGGKPVGATVARYLIGSTPGRTPGRMDGRSEVLPPSTAASFAAYLGAVPTSEGMTMQPRSEHVGAPLPAYHGGVIAGLLEQAGVAAIDPAFRPLDIEIRFLAPALATLPLVARVVPRRTGRRAITLDIDAYQGNPNRPVAIARMLAITDAAGDPVRHALPRE